eukprot:m.462912 g.462912  ORF g.462912 m.462912 type:complete len:569 (-) comp21605_c0_seq3:290-1996(-)
MDREETEAQTIHWLKGRLRAPWAASSIGTQLSLNRLKNINNCFARLDATTKTKILLGFLSIRVRELYTSVDTSVHEDYGNTDETHSNAGSALQTAALRVVEQGGDDADDWVRCMAGVARHYLTKGCIDVRGHGEKMTGAAYTDTIFTSAVRSITDAMSTSQSASMADFDPAYLPLEMPYLGHEALAAAMGGRGNIPRVGTRHFVLKKQPTKAVHHLTETTQRADGHDPGAHPSGALGGRSIPAGSLKSGKSSAGFTSHGSTTFHRRPSSQALGTSGTGNRTSVTGSLDAGAAGVGPRAKRSRLDFLKQKTTTGNQRKNVIVIEDAPPPPTAGRKRKATGDDPTADQSGVPAGRDTNTATPQASASAVVDTPAYTPPAQQTSPVAYAASPNAEYAAPRTPTATSPGGVALAMSPSYAPYAASPSQVPSGTPTDPAVSPSAAGVRPQTSRASDPATRKMSPEAATVHRTPEPDATAPPPAESEADAEARAQLQQQRATVFNQANRLTAENRARIEAFMDNPDALRDGDKDIEQIIIHETRTADQVERVVFEMNFNTSSWRRIKRKKKLKT